MTSPTFRLAQPGEEDQLTELCIRSKAYWGYEAEFLEKTRDDLTVEHSFVHKGMVPVGRESLGGDPIAVSAVNDLGCGEFEIELFFIAPEHIGQGLGRLLFDETVALARRHGATHLRIVADPYARPFYERVGAQVVGEEASRHVAGRTLPLLRYDF